MTPDTDEQTAREYAARVLDSFPPTTLYTKLSREGVVALVTAAFHAGRAAGLALAVEIADNFVMSDGDHGTEIAQAIRAAVNKVGDATSKVGGR